MFPIGSDEYYEAVEAARIHAALINSHVHHDLAQRIPQQDPAEIKRNFFGKILSLFFSPKRGVKWDHMQVGE